MVNTLYLVRPTKQETIFKAKLEDLYKYNSNTLAKAILSGELEFDLQKKIPNIKYPENRECIEDGCKRLARHGSFANLLMCQECYHSKKTSDTWNAAKQCKACGRYYYWDSNGVCPCKSF